MLPIANDYRLNGKQWDAYTKRLTTLLTTKEAASVIKITPTNLRRLATEKRIPAHKVGGQWRFLLAEILGFQEAANAPADASRPSSKPVQRKGTK